MGDYLPYEIWEIILSYLPYPSLSRVCQMFQDIDDSLHDMRIDALEKKHKCVDSHMSDDDYEDMVMMIRSCQFEIKNHRFICRILAEYGDMETIDIVLEEWTPSRCVRTFIASDAARYGHLNIVNRMMMDGVERPYDVYWEAVSADEDEIVEYLRNSWGIGR